MMRLYGPFLSTNKYAFSSVGTYCIDIPFQQSFFCSRAPSLFPPPPTPSVWTYFFFYPSVEEVFQKSYYTRAPLASFEKDLARGLSLTLCLKDLMLTLDTILPPSSLFLQWLQCIFPDSLLGRLYCIFIPVCPLINKMSRVPRIAPLTHDDIGYANVFSSSSSPPYFCAYSFRFYERSSSSPPKMALAREKPSTGR